MVKLPRRSVLGAVGAIWSLSWTEQLSLYLEERTPIGSDSETSSSKSYPRSDVIGNLSGAATAYHTGPHTTDVEVGLYPDEPKPISVELDTGTISAGIVLNQEEAEQLATTLIDSIDEVIEWRDANEYSPILAGFRRENE